MRSQVPPGSGKLHDDLVMSLVLCGVLDEVDWRLRVARGTSSAVM